MEHDQGQCSVALRPQEPGGDVTQTEKVGGVGWVKETPHNT